MDNLFSYTLSDSVLSPSPLVLSNFLILPRVGGTTNALLFYRKIKNL
jgi:hypothetical protein